MMKRIKKLLASVSIMTLFATPMLMPAMAVAQTTGTPNIKNNLCAGANLSTTTTTCEADGGAATRTVDGIITTVINIFSLVVGVISVIMIIIGGLKYITSGGESGNVTGAKNTILYAIIGLVVVALAQVIVKFVLAKVTV